MRLRRPWHWGVALLGNLSAQVPDSLDDRPVAVGEGVIAIGVRHAQDIGAERFEGDWDWATATFYVRSLVEPEDSARRVLCDVVFRTADERISLGDADGEVVLPAPSTSTRVIVSTDSVEDKGLESVWIDFVGLDE